MADLPIYCIRLKLIHDNVSFVIGVLFAGYFKPLVGVNVLYSFVFQGVITGLLLSVSFEFAFLYLVFGEFYLELSLDLFNGFMNIYSNCGTPFEFDQGAGLILYF